jgi:hypothetical protein
MSGYLLSPKLYDDLCRMIRWWRSDSRVLSGGPAGGRLLPQPVSITFRNSSSEQVPAYGIMRIASGGGKLDNAEPYIECVKPDSTFSAQYAVNGTLPVDYGGYGQCWLDGWCRVLYDTGTPATGEGWGPKSGEWTVTKNYPATCDIQSVYDATDKVATVRLHPVESLIGKLDGGLAQGSSATVSIWAGTPNSEADTTWNVTAYDWLMKTGATAIDTGKKVACQQINGVFYVVEAECP